jgi:hypothetical protein
MKNYFGFKILRLSLSSNEQQNFGQSVNFSFSLRLVAWDIAFIFCYVASSLTSNSLVQVLLGLANSVTIGSKSRRNSDLNVLLHLSLGSLYVASNDSQGYGAGILTASNVQ